MTEKPDAIERALHVTEGLNGRIPHVYDPRSQFTVACKVKVPHEPGDRDYCGNWPAENGGIVHSEAALKTARALPAALRAVKAGEETRDGLRDLLWRLALRPNDGQLAHDMVHAEVSRLNIAIAAVYKALGAP